MSDVRLIDGRELHRKLRDLSERYRVSKQFGIARGLSNAMELVVDSPTIDPIRAAGGCRCGECAAYEGHICKNTGFYKSETGWCNDGVPREEQKDG